MERVIRSQCVQIQAFCLLLHLYCRSATSQLELGEQSLKKGSFCHGISGGPLGGRASRPLWQSVRHISRWPYPRHLRYLKLTSDLISQAKCHRLVRVQRVLSFLSEYRICDLSARHPWQADQHYIFRPTSVNYQQHEACIDYNLVRGQDYMRCSSRRCCLGSCDVKPGFC